MAELDAERDLAATGMHWGWSLSLDRVRIAPTTYFAPVRALPTLVLLVASLMSFS